MKGNFLALVFFALFAVACSKDESRTDNQIVGKWHLERNIIYSGKDGKVLSSYKADACEQKQSYEFMADGQCIAKVPMEEEGKCNEYQIAITNYRYNPSAKSITFIYQGGTEDEVEDEIKLYKSSSVEIELEFDEYDPDFDNDGVDDHYISVFSKD